MRRREAGRWVQLDLTQVESFDDGQLSQAPGLDVLLSASRFDEDDYCHDDGVYLSIATPQDSSFPTVSSLTMSPGVVSQPHGGRGTVPLLPDQESAIAQLEPPARRRAQGGHHVHQPAAGLHVSTVAPPRPERDVTGSRHQCRGRNSATVKRQPSQASEEDPDLPPRRRPRRLCTVFRNS